LGVLFSAKNIPFSMTPLVKNSQIAQTMFLFFSIVPSINELFFAQKQNSQQALNFILNKIYILVGVFNNGIVLVLNLTTDY